MSYSEIVNGLVELIMNKADKEDKDFYILKDDGTMGAKWSSTDTHTKYTVGSRSFQVTRSAHDKATADSERDAIRRVIAPDVKIAPQIGNLIDVKERILKALDLKVSKLTAEQADEIKHEVSNLYHEIDAALDRNVKNQKQAKASKTGWSFSS
jgi:hypothetical protein